MRKRQEVIGLRLLVDVFYYDIDGFLDVVLLQRHDVDEVGIFEDLGRLECWRRDSYLGGAVMVMVVSMRRACRSQGKQRKDGREDGRCLHLEGKDRDAFMNRSKVQLRCVGLS